MPRMVLQNARSFTYKETMNFQHLVLCAWETRVDCNVYTLCSFVYIVDRPVMYLYTLVNITLNCKTLYTYH